MRLVYLCTRNMYHALGGCDAALIAVKQMGYVRILEHYTNMCAGSISNPYLLATLPGRVAQPVGHLTRKSGVLGSIPGLATYFRFSFRFFKKGSCQLLAKVCARSTG